jgi:hypothetical protein
MHIFVADHQAKVRFALRTLLVRQPGLEVVGEADTVEDLLAGVEATQPDLLLLHWRLGEGAEAFVCKMDPPDKLLAAIEKVRVKHGEGKGGRRSLRTQRRGGSARKLSVDDWSEEKGGLEIRGLGGGNPEPVPQSGS